ncbi:hypothetical protein OEA41_004161 [Lepraria neglecta]|uniref:Uncharacterized protein n=1 Tax=Lepraria neglecta TaxID=209136 RepID=A0AAE0DJM1_9LECA|nr:hypothetical protein OEA41_004161 [Lepraria neglecta]
MADQVVDSVPSYSSPSSTSILNKLPTKRIDAAVTAAAESGIPEQGEQTGGHNPTYAHFSHLPFLPLYSQAQHDLLAKQQALKEQRVKHMDATDPDKLLNGSQKATLSVVGHLSGGGSIVGVKRWERRLKGASVIASNRLMEQNKLIVFTRWTVPTTTPSWFVDVLEYRFLDPGSKMGWNVVMLKAGLASFSSAKKDGKVKLKLLKTDAKGLKSQKLWTKRWNYDPCEAVTFIDDDGKEVPMEIVARLQRACSSLEAQEVQKRFKKQWVVPVL